MTKADNVFESFAQAYGAVVKDVLVFGREVSGVKDVHSVGSEFGTKNRPTRELLAYSFTVKNPRSRGVHSESRQVRKPYALASFFWTLFGTRKASLILPFNPRGKIFLSKSGDLPSAIGPHVFRKRKNQYLEFERIIALLKLDPSSRRAVVQFLSNSDLGKNLRDVPCYNFIQFFVRDETLHSHVAMRSQSALMVLPYDFYLFSMLHEALSLRLSVNPGPIHYTSSSMHIYEDEMKLAEEVLINPIDQIEHDRMSDFSNKTIESLKRFFKDLSTTYLSNNKIAVGNIDKYNLDHYWSTMIRNHFN